MPSDETADLYGGVGFLRLGSDEEEDVERIQISSVVSCLPEVFEESESSSSMVSVDEGLIVSVKEDEMDASQRREEETSSSRQQPLGFLTAEVGAEDITVKGEEQGYANLMVKAFSATASESATNAYREREAEDASQSRRPRHK